LRALKVFCPKPQTANRDELAANTSRPILMVGVVCSFFFSSRSEIGFFIGAVYLSNN
jgi:hypothetical protein